MTVRTTWRLLLLFFIAFPIGHAELSWEDPAPEPKIKKVEEITIKTPPSSPIPDPIQKSIETPIENSTEGPSVRFFVRDQKGPEVNNPNPINAETTKPELNAPTSLQPLSHNFWPLSPSYLYLREKPLPLTLQDFCKMQDINLVMSAKLSSNTQVITQNFEKIYPMEIWDQLTKAYGILWFYDGHILYAYESNEIETKVLKIHPQQISPLLELIEKLGFVGSNIGLNPMREGGILIVSGAPKMINLIETMTSNMQFYQNLETDFLDVKIFVLKHAWAEDKSIGSLTIPGVATLLKNILGKEKTKETSPLPQTKPAQKVASVKELSENENKEQDSKPKIILPEGGLITTDNRQNAIIVKDYSKNLPLYKNLLDKLDVPLDLIEINAAFVEVQKGYGIKVGNNGQLVFNENDPHHKIAFAPLDNSGNNQSNTGTFQLNGVVNGGHFLAAIDYLESQNRSKVLSRPSVITMNNLAATMSQGSTYYLPMKASKEGSLYSIETNTSITVTPHIIHENGTTKIQLLLDIKNDSRAPDGGQNTEGVTTKTASLSTQAVVYEGQSVLVGGFFEESFNKGKTGIPLLGKIPLLGHLFKHSTKNKATSERLFLITPKIIHLSADMDDYAGLFSTPSSLLNNEERISTKFIKADAIAPEVLNPEYVNNEIEISID